MIVFAKESRDSYKPIVGQRLTPELRLDLIREGWSWIDVCPDNQAFPVRNIDLRSMIEVNSVTKRPIGA